MQLFKGLIDDVRIYNRALSEAEIRDLYNMGQTVSGKINGLNSPFSVTCENVTTGITVLIPKAKQSWDCEAKDLEVNPGDQIQTTSTVPQPTESCRRSPLFPHHRTYGLRISGG